MLYEKAKQLKAAAEVAETKASEALLAVPGVGSGPCGLTPDAVKRTPEYRAAVSNHALAFGRMARTNQWFFKNFKNEAYAERLAKHANFG